jgi:hypothetical protein
MPDHLKLVAEMTPLTERQTTAERLTRWLARMDAHVLNPMPLEPQSQLRFQVVNESCDNVLAQLAKEGWSPLLVSTGLRFCVDGVARNANTYEIHLEPDRQFVVDSRITGEIAEKKKWHEVDDIIADYYGRKR